MDLIVENLSVVLKGTTILDKVNLQLEAGKIYGFVGKNGSGKTMLFRALSGLINIESGTVSYQGKILHKDIKILPDIGLIIENAGLYPELTGFRNLQLLAKLNNKVSDNDIKEMIRKVELDPEDKRAFRKYSLGMKQRIILAQAFMESPRILMLDEPTNALDEHGVETIRNLIIDAKKGGAIILLASHNKEDMETLADEIYLIQGGRISKKGEPDEA